MIPRAGKDVDKETGPMDIEDLEPRNKPARPKDLEVLGVAELEDYLAKLEAEVIRVKAKIESKTTSLAGAHDFFNS